MIPAAAASAIGALLPELVNIIASAVGRANASAAEKAKAEKDAREYIQLQVQPRDAALAPDYAAAKEAAMESPPLTLSDADVESDRDPYASDR